MQTEIYYRKVMNDLRRRIVNGDYARGEFIPSEERLQAGYGVSRTTVRTAVKELVDEGLLQIVRGKGTRVCFSTLHTVPESMFSVCEEVRSRGMSLELKRVEIVEMKATDYIAGKLGCQPDTPIWRIFRLIYADGEPFSQNYSFEPAALFGHITKEELAAKLQEYCSFYYYLEKELGIRIITVQDEMSAINGDDNNVYLNRKKGDAVFRIERVGFDQHNDPVEYAQSYIRGDRFTQHLTIRRK